MNTFFDHWEELRGRVVKIAVLFILVSCVFYPATGALLAVIIKPVGNVVFTAPAEAFLVHMYLSLAGGFLFTLPYTIYHIWMFIAAGLTDKERGAISWFAPLSFFFFIAGSSFAYFIILPISLQFLLGFSSVYIQPMISIGKYLGFVIMLVLSFGIVFELPLVLGFLSRIGLVKPEFFIKYRRAAILIIVIVSALLTPPDVITQIMMSIPLVGLYELGIVFSKTAYKKD